MPDRIRWLAAALLTCAGVSPLRSQETTGAASTPSDRTLPTLPSSSSAQGAGPDGVRTIQDSTARSRAALDSAASDSATGDSTVSGRSAPQPSFRFSQEAGLGLRAMWEESVAAKQERVACLSAEVRHDTAYVSRILELTPHEADSMSIGSEASIERCGPPTWSGTVHTHVAAYSDDRPSTRFSAQDRGVMRRWYERWHADGVFCLVYSARDAHCEADGVVGGMRGRPVLVR